MPSSQWVAAVARGFDRSQPPLIVLGTSLMSKYRNFGPNPIGRPYHPGRYLRKLEATKEEKKKEKIGTEKRKTKKKEKRKENESSMKRNKNNNFFS